MDAFMHVCLYIYIVYLKRIQVKCIFIYCDAFSFARLTLSDLFWIANVRYALPL